MALILVMITMLAACGIIIGAVASDDDICAPADTAIDVPTGGSLMPGQKVKPMHTADFQISSGFGPRDGTTHQGIDMAGPEGAPIFAAADGTVIAAGDASGFGQWIVLDHNVNGHKWSTVYGHMWPDGVLVKPGQHVTAGQLIAERGNNGQSSGAHLHFEVWDGGHRDFGGGTAIDPTGWVTEGIEPGSTPVVAGPAPEVMAAPAPAPAPAPGPAAPSDPSIVTAADWDKVAHLESGGNWAIDTGNGYFGGLQFSPATWTGNGGGQYAATADKATREQQMEIANKVLGTQGWPAWPTTSVEAGVTNKKPAPAGAFVNAATAPKQASAPDPDAARDSGPLPALPASKGAEAHFQVDAIRVARAISAKFPQIQTIGGWRADGGGFTDHPSGRAVDVMIPNYTAADGIALGDQVHKYVLDNKDFFHVEYTIWRQRYTAADGTTHIMEDRGGQTANHFDHVHITVVGGGMPTGSEVYTAPGVTGGSTSSTTECAPSETTGGGVDNLVAGKVPPEYEPWFRKAGKLCPQISSALLAGIGKQETGFNATLISPDGAKGPMQFMDYTYPSWAKDDDGNGTASQIDIGDAVMAAGRYSCDNARQVDAAIAAGTVKAPADGGREKLYAESYNAGVGAILSAGGEPSGGDYDTQTRPYGAKVVRYMSEFSKQGLD